MYSKNRDKRHSILLYWIIFLTLSSAISAHEWDSVWTRTYGGVHEDCAYAVAVDSEGYYVIAGCTFTDTTAFDVFLVKIHPLNGDTVWERTYTPAGWSSQQANAVAVDPEGYYVIAGQYSDASTMGWYNFWIFKIEGSFTSMTTLTYFFGGIFISPLIFLIPVVTPLRSSISLTDSSS